MPDWEGRVRGLTNALVEEGVTMRVLLDDGVVVDFSQFNHRQISQILMGAKLRLKVSIYADPKYDSKQMNEILLGLLGGLDVSSYTDPNLSDEQMKEIRLELERKEIEKREMGISN